ncbi:MAG: hypothetical protein KJ077_20135 [Anaerolineae bacterium]|nr:hypothetical protein [Anaerolineae bacterium]
MADFVIKTGDLLILAPLGLPLEPPPPPKPLPPPAPPPPPPSIATVLLPPFPIIGFLPTTINYARLCVQGDEAKIPVIQAPVPYASITYPVPGTGRLTITLNSDQIAQIARCGGQPVILKGTTFQVKLQVITPALFPPPPAPPLYPDSITTYTGTGAFQTTNSTIRGE